MSSTTTTPFPLGVFVGDANSADPSAEATFDAGNQAFDSLMGATPTFMNTYIDFGQTPSNWLSNTEWAASSSAASSSWKGEIPVIALPMGSTNTQAPSAQQILENYADGSYDNMLQGMVKAWSDNGFKTQYWRPGAEMNLSSTPGFVGSSPSMQALWIAAFQHIYTTLHAAAQADGVNLKVIWNPGITNDSLAGKATETLYPGNQYVDVIGADVYANVYTYSLYDWDKSGQEINSPNPVYDTSLQEWASDPINLEHYYTDPASDQYSLDASQGNSLSLQNLIDFAKAQGKPICVCETGAGNTSDGAGLSDNPVFVQWLSSTLENSGVTVDYVSIWDSDSGGTYAFSNAGDDKPEEEAAWAKYFGAQSETTAATPITITPTTEAVATTDTVKVAPFKGVAIKDANSGQTETAIVTLSSAANGSLIDPNAATDGSTSAAGVWSVSGSPTAVAAALDGLMFQPTENQVAAGSTVGTKITATVTDTAGETASATSTVTATQVANAAPTVDSLVLNISEDAWKGNAEFTVSVDGKQVGGDYTASTLHASGDAGTFLLTGDWSSGVNHVQVSFINDAYGGTSATDRNLYVKSIAYNGITYAGTTASLYGDSTDTFTVGGNTPRTSGAADTVTLNLSEDAWKGDAEFVLYIDGKAVTAPQSVTALHSQNATETFTFTGNLGAGVHKVGVALVNDAYGGSPSEDRNLYINGVTVNGSDVFSGIKAQDGNGSSLFTITTAS
jgi:hypothetical protein